MPVATHPGGPGEPKGIRWCRESGVGDSDPVLDTVQGAGGRGACLAEEVGGVRSTVIKDHVPVVLNKSCLTGKRKYTGENDGRSDSHGIVGLFNKRGS